MSFEIYDSLNQYFIYGGQKLLVSNVGKLMNLDYFHSRGQAQLLRTIVGESFCSMLLESRNNNYS